MEHTASRQRPARQAGFTLVEMSVVLLVIGLVLGAISISKDMQRNAEYVKIKQKFIDQWASAYNTYYLRTGVVLGDSQVAPNFMVNGASYALGTSGGNMTGVTGPFPICDNDGGAGGGTATATATLYDEMDRHGVRMPPGRAEGREARYVYLDTNGNPQEIEVCFQWNRPGTASNSGNVMVIKGLTPDLARALDQMIDGKPDARYGMFRQEGTTATTSAEWAANNTNAFGVTPAAAIAENGLRRDEDQVITVTAHYKMPQ
jgi:prepilin-type N-terminal cleavage/methylation domain-containing protein